MVSWVMIVVFQGIEVVLVDVQVYVGLGMVVFIIVGLLDKVVVESWEWVCVVLLVFGLVLLVKWVIVNLVFVDLFKEGLYYDLLIVFGVMIVIGVILVDYLDNYVVFGELVLDGLFVVVVGVFLVVIVVNILEKGLICLKDSGGEVVWVDSDMDILVLCLLIQFVNYFKGIQVLFCFVVKLWGDLIDMLDFKDVKGQESVKWVFEIVVVGGYNFLMIGLFGFGKFMLVSCLLFILFLFSLCEFLEVFMIVLLVGELVGGKLFDWCLFCVLYYLVLMVVLVGGGIRVKLGEVLLVYNGVLFFDELLEFNLQVFDSLCQLLESGEVIIVWVNYWVIYLVCIQMVVVMNFCCCGYVGEFGYQCWCGECCVIEYQVWFFGLFLDWIDVRIEVFVVMVVDLIGLVESELLDVVVVCVVEVWVCQEKWFFDLGVLVCINVQVLVFVVEEIVLLDDKGLFFLCEVVEILEFSVCGYYWVLKFVWMFVDFDGLDIVGCIYLVEVFSYCGWDLLWWVVQL